MEEDRPGGDLAEVRCEMVLFLEIEPAQEIKWCPLPTHDKFALVFISRDWMGAEITPSGKAHNTGVTPTIGILTFFCHR